MLTSQRGPTKRGIQAWSLIQRAPGVHGTSILRAAFLYINVLCSFYVLAVWVCNFLQKEISAKAARKMLVKLTTDENYFGGHDF